MKTGFRFAVLFCLILIVLATVTPGCIYLDLQKSPTPISVTTPPPIDPDYAPPPTEENRELPTVPDFVSIIASVRPSVVAINTRISGVDIFGGSSFQEGAGSGWILDESGLIATNNHVVEGAETITVTLEDGRNFPAQFVRTDILSDLAVIKINAANLKPAKIGNSTRLRVGDWVVAIGNSLGQGISATKGIVSALNVSIPVGSGNTLYDLIQTDAAINPGNSGGPLVNTLGEVDGITSVKVADVGVEGTGYAISTRVAMPIIEELVKVGYIIRPWIGVNLYTVDRIVTLRYRLEVDHGALVTRGVSKSPADQAGIQAGDVITDIGSKKVSSVDDFTAAMHDYKVGEQVQITFYRDNKRNTVTITLAPSPPQS